ncbi:Protein FAR1-RELATED SEQUENCE [Arachis hypogaea]|nr:Protein FAR1-RELATED SEQUENCE [Arachis hypogaea]
MACMEGESVMNHSDGSLCAKEERSDAYGPGSNKFEDGGLGVDSKSREYFGDNFYDNWEERAVDGIAKLGCINFKEITAEIMMCHFSDRSVAFLFYSLYAKMNGFAVRKNKIQRNVKNEVTQQEFVCFRQGSRDIGFVNDGLRQKREAKAETRCGCEAKMRVHVHLESGRWIISYFQEVYNHKFLEDRLTCMLSGHRKMDAVIVEQMNMMLKVDIKMPQIYSSFVHTGEGFQNVPFLKRDMYNQIGKQRRLIGGDAMSCLKFLESTAQEDPGIYFLDAMKGKAPGCDIIDGHGVMRKAIEMSPLHDLEMSASNKLTKEIFFLFSPMLFRTCTLKSKNARSKVRAFVEKALFCWDSTITLDAELKCREMCVLQYGDEAEFVDMMDKVCCEISRLKEKKDCGDLGDRNKVRKASTLEGCVRDPQMARHPKWQRKDANHTLVKGVKRCNICHHIGHNRLSCQLNPNSRRNTQEGASYFGTEGEDETGMIGDSSEEMAWNGATEFGLAEDYNSEGEISYPYFN